MRLLLFSGIFSYVQICNVFLAYFDTIDEIPEIVYDEHYPEDTMHAFTRNKDINENTEVVYVLPHSEGSRA